MFRKSAPSSPVKTAEAARPSLMSPGKLAYEARRAKDAGMSVEAWLSKKTRDAAEAASEKLRVASKPAPKPKGFISRLLDRAHKPLG